MQINGTNIQPEDNEAKKSDDWIRRFYNSVAWRKKRAYILLRDKYQCQYCKARGRVVPANEVHHIKELRTHRHLALVDSNLISLCRECHEETKKRETKRIKIPNGVRVIKP